MESTFFGNALKSELSPDKVESSDLVSTHLKIGKNILCESPDIKTEFIEEIEGDDKFREPLDLEVI